MDFSSLLLMRHEFILTALLLLMIVAEIVVSEQNKKNLVNFGVLLFAIHTAVGLLPLADGVLFGGMFKTTVLTHFFKSVLNIGVLILLLQSGDWLRDKVASQQKATEFFMLIFSSLLGLYFMISAGDFLMFYIGLELSTLPVAALAAYESLKQKSSESGIKLILSAALASGTSLFGITMMYATSGSLFFDAMTITASNLTILGFLMFFAGLAFKISLAPFHFWTADVYEGAPISVASYLSVISKGAAAFVLMILLFTLFRPLESIWINLMYGVALLTMFIGNLFAIRQQNLKRFLAFSSIAQAGFILLGLLSVNQLGATTIIYFIMIYVFSNLGAFGVVQAISNQTGKENIDDYDGLYRTNPKLSLVMLLALFSLAGIPPVAGFFGKFFLFTAAASQGYYLLVFIAVVNVTISLYYYLLVVRAMFLRKSENAIPYFESKFMMKLGLTITVLGILIIGMYSPLYDYIFEISNLIFKS
jgi:NADH-quinone oxidoreductase subunit N